MSKEIRAKNREFRREAEAAERKDHRKYMDGFCVKSLASNGRGACINHPLPEENPKSCANCIGFSNFEE
jgi:hypothetical protein